MTYTAITTLSNGNVLNAPHLNTLSANQEFLYALANQANIPFNSYRDTVSTLVKVWDIRHRVRYLHYKITSEGGTGDYCRVYYNGVKIAGNEAGATTFSGYYDLTSWAGLPNLVGAWSGSSVSHDDDVNGDGTGGNSDDGDVVTNGGHTTAASRHTSGGTSEPGVGASWTTYWDLLTLPSVLSFCTVSCDEFCQRDRDDGGVFYRDGRHESVRDSHGLRKAAILVARRLSNGDHHELQEPAWTPRTR